MSDNPSPSTHDRSTRNSNIGTPYPVLVVMDEEERISLELADHHGHMDLILNAEPLDVELRLKDLEPMELLKACWYMVNCASKYCDREEVLQYLADHPVGTIDKEREIGIARFDES
jgi:hypothetical protein